MERNREKRAWLKALLQEAFEDQLRVTLIRSVDLRYSRMRGSGKTLGARGTSEVEPRKFYVLCIAITAVQGALCFTRISRAGKERANHDLNRIKGESGGTERDDR